MATILEKLRDDGRTLKISQKTWKVTFVVEDINNPEQKCKVLIEILKFRALDKYCVQFKRKGGDFEFFNQQAQRLIYQIDCYHNAWLDE